MFIDGKIPDRPPKNSAEYATVILLSVLFIGMLGFSVFKEYTPFKLSIPFFLLSWVILLVVHEFGHALMAKALGWRVELVSIGTGSKLATKTIFGMKTEFRAIPLSGFAVPRPSDLIQPRFKSFLIYAAGPGIELLAVVLICGFVDTRELVQLSPSIPLIAAQSFCVAALVGVFINLIPIPFTAENGRTNWTDGLGMIMSWRLPDSYFADLIHSESEYK